MCTFLIMRRRKGRENNYGGRKDKQTPDLTFPFLSRLTRSLSEGRKREILRFSKSSVIELRCWGLFGYIYVGVMQTLVPAGRRLRMSKEDKTLT